MAERPAHLSVDVRLLPPEQIEQACMLFASVFGHPVTPEQWHWKYRLGPRLGQVNVGARDPQGRWVGHAGAIVFPGVCRGRPLPMAQVCDIMVERDARGGLGPQGVYPRLVDALRRQLRERFPGVFAYGFPGVRPFKLGERAGFYRRLYDCRVSTLGPAAPPGRPRRSWTATAVDWDPSRLDRLWARLALRQARPALARTADYLGWRYRDHPRHVYRLWLLKRWFRDAGWLVTRAMPDGSHCVVDALLAADSEAPAACAALWYALAGQDASPPTVQTWLALPNPRDTSIVATEFLVGEWHTDLPVPSFQPGDTDVY